MEKALRCPICNQINKEFHKIDENAYKCDVCNATFHMLSEEENIALEQAKNCHTLYEFSKADLLYKQLYNKTKNEKTKIMCLIGRLFATFGIIFIKDRNDFLVTTFSKYNPEVKTIKENEFYKEIIDSDYATDYIEILDKAEKEYQNIRNELKNKPEYDVFICVKITNSTEYEPLNEERTKDSIIALDIYNELRNKGYKVFYSEESLTGDIKYDGQIYSALLNSKSLLVISSSLDYLESPWVQSEWQRWLNLIDRNIKRSNSLFFYKSGEFHMPSVLERIQKYSNKDAIIKRIDKFFIDESENEISSRIKEVNALMKVAEYAEAQKILIMLSEKYPKDYRPWIGLVDLLIYSNVPNTDTRYENFLENALRLADQKEKIEIQEKYKKFLKVNSEVTIEQELNEASSLAIFGQYNEAEQKYISLCKKYIDYRIWVGLLDLLKLQSVDARDPRYSLYLSKAIEICPDERIKQKLENTYDVKKEILKSDEKKTI